MHTKTMNTQSISDKIRNAWNRPWSRLQVGYYVATSIVLFFLMAVPTPVVSIWVDLLVAASWPISTLLAVAFGLAHGQFSALLIPVICYGPYFLIADICATLNARRDRE